MNVQNEQQNGYSIVELNIAIALMLIVTGIAIMAFMHQTRTFTSISSDNDFLIDKKAIQSHLVTDIQESRAFKVDLATPVEFPQIQIVNDELFVTTLSEGDDVTPVQVQYRVETDADDISRVERRVNTINPTSGFVAGGVWVPMNRLTRIENNGANPYFNILVADGIDNVRDRVVFEAVFRTHDNRTETVQIITSIRAREVN